MNLERDLSSIISSDRVKCRPVDVHAYARDASFYRLIPQAVVEPVNEQEVVSLLAYARDHGLPMVFRAAGTSLSGQSITDGILVLIGRYWRDYRVEEDGTTVTLEPGIIGAVANQYLRDYGRKIGPDPASINSCFVGGILANNASGMCCGVVHNAYHTLERMRFVLPNGLTFDSGAEDADDKLKMFAPDVHEGLRALRERVLANDALKTKIRSRYERKNTVGYSLNALVDFEQPMDMLVHLMIGSEGTLGFISEATLRTLPDPPEKATALLIFESIEGAAKAARALKLTGAAALEIMDRASLRAVAREPGMPEGLDDLPMEAAALLVEYQEMDEEALAERVAAGEGVLAEFSLVGEAGFTSDGKTRAQYWKVRKGLFPAVGAVRKAGTTVIIEDICFRNEDLAGAIGDLQELFQKHRYWNGIIFGHAKEGNLHFVISQPFDDEDGVARYDAFMKDVVAMTVGKYDGALKAEHGTGRNMAPFVETEWGPEALEIMQELKALVDPTGFLNPGVILNANAQCHLEDIKPLTAVSPVVDACIECGFCERLCPSREVTMTPRRRIAAAREVAFLKRGDKAGRELAVAIGADLEYESEETCATDGLCAMACPVKIDTGQMVKALRARRNSGKAVGRAGWISRHIGVTSALARTGLRAGHVGAGLLGHDQMIRVSQWFGKRVGGQLPQWHPLMPEAAEPLPAARHRGGESLEEIVYFPSCVTRNLGRLPEERDDLSPTEALMELLRLADIHARYPEGVESLCCGQAFSSKGYDEAAREILARTVKALYDASQQGRLPVVIDTSPCTLRLRTGDELLSGDALAMWHQLTVLDIVEFLHDVLLERVMPAELPVPVVVHPVCSVEKMGLREKLLGIAQQCAVRVIVPEEPSCCGFAGDRGFLFPELTDSATRDEASFVQMYPPNSRHVSTCRTCELGMTAATGRTYSSVIYLVYDAVARSANR